MFPKDAKKVFSGVIFDVYQWQQEMYDGTFETFEKLRRRGAVEVLAVTDNGKIIIQHQTQPDRPEPFLCPIGGGLDVGETHLAAAKREMREETGYEAKEWELLHELNPTNKIDWPIAVFIARKITRVGEPQLDAGEKIDLIEVDFDAFIRMVDSGEISRIEHDLRSMCIRAVYDKQKYAEFKKLILGA